MNRQGAKNAKVLLSSRFTALPTYGLRNKDTTSLTMNEIIDRILEVSADIRYVAVYRDGQLTSRERGGLSGASSSESDRYEEFLVNPTLLTLVRQRGDIDCGGAIYVLVRYGNFFHLITPVSGGHVSIALETRADPLALVGQIRDVLVAAGLAAKVLGDIASGRSL